MSEGPKLYAWVIPAVMNNSPADHTWVTSFDNREIEFSTVAEVIASDEIFWFCWGDYHAKARAPGASCGLIGSQLASLDQARYLVAPNIDSFTASAARGTIFDYGWDGVCHQLANQVLYATGATGHPITVRGARGYMASSFIYGTYGLQHAAWAKKLRGLTKPAVGLRGKSMPTPIDDFETRARAVLRDRDDETLARLLTLRLEAQRTFTRSVSKQREMSAEEINSRNQRLIDNAAELLGPERFEEIFGFAPGQIVALVDPEIMARASAKK